MFGGYFCPISVGEAGTGIANLVVDAMKEKGLSDAEARARC
jgi:hypothetical protein